MYIRKCLLLIAFSLQTLFSYELGIVSLFRNEANYLKEWVEYHHLLGVDHFLLYNDRSTDHWHEVLESYIASGLVEVFDWSLPEGTPLFPTWQIFAYQDGLHKSLGNTKWLAFIDVDEFILPKKNRTILECLDQFFPTASGVYACWRNFGTNGVYVNPGDPLLPKLTACSYLSHSRNASGKSIVKVDDVVINHVWSPHQLPLKSGCQYYNGSGRPLYFQGLDLKVDPAHTSDYIQINHYVMKDENFYEKVRLPRALSREYGEISLLKEHYTSFNQTQNTEILDFLMKYYPEMYQSFWLSPQSGTKISIQ